MEHIIREKYLVESVLQRTPVGQVYKTSDLSSDREPALVKELTPSPSIGISLDEIKDRYNRETAILSKITHPGIPRLTDFFCLGEKHYIVLEYFRGSTLDSLSMKRATPFQISEVLKWGINLCEILQVLHTALDEPIIFRDITPSNIIITDEGDVKLGDFGLTRYFNPQKLKDTFVMGTPGFSPPEQYGKGQSDERSDIYSLGATLFYSLTLHCVEEFTTTPPLRKLNPLLPGAVEKVILTSIQKDPKKRQQTAKQFKEDLEKCRK